MTPSHYTFIDLENVPSVDLALLEGHPVHATILIGARQKKLDLEMVQQIHRLGTRVELIEVGASGPNALDLTLSCYLGRALERHPTASFSIISRDRDFDPMIGHLIRQGIAISRHAGLHVVEPAPRKSAAPSAPPIARRPAPSTPARSASSGPSRSAAGSAEDRIARIVARLGNPSNSNRPTRRRGLIAQIKSSLGKNATDSAAAAVVSDLELEGVLSIDDKDYVRYSAD